VPVMHLAAVHARTRASTAAGRTRGTVERTASRAGDQAHGYDRARVWGSARIDEACAAWEAAG